MEQQVENLRLPSRTFIELRISIDHRSLDKSTGLKVPVRSRLRGTPQALLDMQAQTAQHVLSAVGPHRRAYVLVNNRSEGNAPLTVQGLVGMLGG